MLYAKDRGCSAPGCTVPGYYCEVHHVTDYATCRTTDVNELTFACGPQHRILEPGGWSTRKNARGDTEWIPPPHLERGQPRTNTFHHPEKLLRDEDGRRSAVALADRDALKQEVTALQSGLIGELRLGVVPAAATTVALLTDPFCAAHPLVRVQLETNLRSAGIVERIRRFELDAGILLPGPAGHRRSAGHPAVPGAAGTHRRR